MEQQPNNRGNRPPKQPAPRRARLRLPFENRKQDPVDWIYDNRFGICITSIVLLAMAVIFVWVKIGIPLDAKESEPEKDKNVYVDASEMLILEQEQTPVEQEQTPVEQEREITLDDWRSVQNLSSNENASEGEALRNDKGIDKELKRLQEAAAKGAEENRKNMEKGLNEVEAMIGDAAANKKESTAEKKRESSNVAGNVVVEYSFSSPVRHHVNLIKPAYLCEEGGQVVVEVVLNQSGKIVYARAISGGNERMQRVAEESARASTFNIDGKAPAKQKGTITYIFIPQY